MNWRALMRVEDQPPPTGSQYSHNSQKPTFRAHSANIANTAKGVESLHIDNTDHEESPPVPHDHRQKIIKAVETFFQVHGDKLGRLGWNNKTLFSGLDPTTAKTYDDIPGLAVMLVDGAELIHTDYNHLEFESHNCRLIWVREQFWLGGKAAKEWKDRHGQAQ
jgi:hypothetical protein